MIENKLFEALLDVIPFAAYAVDIDTYEVVYANKIMRENMFAPQEKHCWAKVFGQNKICDWCSIKDLKNRKLKNRSAEKLTRDFFYEIDDKWIKSYNELISWPDGRDVKYSILIDITDQKAIQGDMIRAHAKLAMNNKHITLTNKNLQITKLKFQKSLNELESVKKSKFELFHTMSDEIKMAMDTTLSSINAMKKTTLSPEQSERIKAIENSSKNLLDKIDKLSNFTK
ncbi:hypothetical protein KKA17_05865 [bacterium]|nr:hypothetical protein [bacterium]MBU1884929.1 hypothetical protein [bacterium]